MQALHSLGSMASGGDAGNEAKPKKPAKDNKLAGRATFRKPDPSEEQTSSGGSETNDFGMRNVSHRGAQMHDSELTELQRMQLEMSKLNNRIEMMRNNPGGEASEAASTVVPVYQSHPLDNLEVAQVCDEFTIKALAAPTKYRKPDRFMMDFHTYDMDVNQANQTEEYLKALNTHPDAKESGTWWSNCFPLDGAEPMGYYSPFPGQSSGMVDLHGPTRPSSLSLMFTLDTANMTHKEFVDRYRNRPGQDGTVKLTIPLATIKGLISAELGDMDIERSPYHLQVLDVQVTDQICNAPVAFDKVFLSSSAVNEGMMCSWSTPRGVDKHAVNMIGAPEGEDANRYYNVIHPDGASNIVRAPNTGDAVYIGEPCKNGAEFTRWINRDWKEVKHDLDKVARGNTYTIELPHTSKFKDFTFIQWFVFWNMKDIHRRTLISGEEPDQKAGRDTVLFNKLYSMDENHNNNNTLISKRVLDAMLKEKRAQFDQEKHLMRLEKTQLVLWPVQGPAGWDAYESISEDNAGIMMKAKERVKFSCEITVTYQPFRQAMLQPRSQASSSASPHSGHRGKAHEAIANSFNSASS
jgi:hypothetical protein